MSLKNILTGKIDTNTTEFELRIIRQIEQLEEAHRKDPEHVTTHERIRELSRDLYQRTGGTSNA